jgi:hypothetical protein
MSLLTREQADLLKGKILAESILTPDFCRPVFRIIDSCINFESNATIPKVDDIALSQEIKISLELDINNFTRISAVSVTDCISFYPRQIKELYAILGKVIDRLEHQDVN